MNIKNYRDGFDSTNGYALIPILITEGLMGVEL